MQPPFTNHADVMAGSLPSTSVAFPRTAWIDRGSGWAAVSPASERGIPCVRRKMNKTSTKMNTRGGGGCSFFANLSTTLLRRRQRPSVSNSWLPIETRKNETNPETQKTDPLRPRHLRSRRPVSSHFAIHWNWSWPLGFWLRSFASFATFVFNLRIRVRSCSFVVGPTKSNKTERFQEIPNLTTPYQRLTATSPPVVRFLFDLGHSPLFPFQPPVFYPLRPSAAMPTVLRLSDRCSRRLMYDEKNDFSF
jgi:hypothetical protein